MNGFVLGCLVLLAIILGPLVILWSLNVVFGVPAVYDLNHWFGVLVLGMAIRGGIKYRGE